MRPGTVLEPSHHPVIHVPHTGLLWNIRRYGLGLPVAVYWDFVSVYHDVPGSMLTTHQQSLHERGLAAAAYEQIASNLPRAFL